MSLWIDESFLKQLSYRLEGFEQVKTHQWICRCPLCGDSQKKKNKKRGYFYETEDGLTYHCFNCTITKKFKNFLKDFDFNLYRQYQFEKFKTTANTSAGPPGKVVKKELIGFDRSFFEGLPRINELDPGHYARQYIADRKIPKRFWDEMYFCENFVAWTTKFTDTYKHIKEHPRILIPFYDEDKNLIYFQGRSFGKVEPKYLTCKVDEAAQIKAYGLDRLNKKKPVIVLEGPIDSMFLQNSVAVASSAVHNFSLPGCDHVYVYDNEPRNPEITKLMKAAIDDGKTVVIWPHTIKEKDINDMVKAGINVQEVIAENACSGAKAKLRFNLWVK